MIWAPVMYEIECLFSLRSLRFSFNFSNFVIVSNLKALGLKLGLLFIGLRVVAVSISYAFLTELDNLLKRAEGTGRISIL